MIVPASSTQSSFSMARTAGVALDRHHGDHGAEAPHLALRIEVGRRLEPRRLPRRQGRAARIRGRGHLLPGDPPLGHADDLEAPGDRRHVRRRRLEEPGRDASALVGHLGGHAGERPAAERDAAAPEGPEALGPAARVAVDDHHVLRGHAEMVGHDLGERGLVSLAVGAGAR